MSLEVLNYVFGNVKLSHDNINSSNDQEQNMGNSNIRSTSMERCSFSSKVAVLVEKNAAKDEATHTVENEEEREESLKNAQEQSTLERDENEQKEKEKKDEEE